MNGKCKGCKYKCTKPSTEHDHVYQIPACSATLEQYEKCIEIKKQYATLPVHLNDDYHNKYWLINNKIK